MQTEYYDGENTTTRKFVYLGGSVIRELNNAEQTVKEYIRDGGLGGGIGGRVYQRIPQLGDDDYYTTITTTRGT